MLCLPTAIPTNATQYSNAIINARLPLKGCKNIMYKTNIIIDVWAVIKKNCTTKCAITISEDVIPVKKGKKINKYEKPLKHKYGSYLAIYV